MQLKVHFIGIGGIGMSALAQYYLAKGWLVSGSDLVDLEIIKDLKKIGVKIFIGHKPSNVLKKINRVIYSAAIKIDNPEYDKSKNLGVEFLSYAEALGELTRGYFTLAVSGSHGKSTTTALLSLALITAGLDPTVIIGTRLREFGGLNFRIGKSKYLVIEADEYNRSFLNYNPDIAVTTNIDKEHLDTYGNLKEIIKSFAEYFSRLKKDGALVINRNDDDSLKALFLLKPGVDKNIKIIKYNRPKTDWPLKILGDFNQLNAEAAWQAVKLLGIKEKIFRQAVSKFSGSWRRMEELKPRFKKNNAKGQKFYADYAHHPTEIRATLNALRLTFPSKKLVIVFQAHQAYRLKKLFYDFIRSFDLANMLILLPVYKVVGREDKEDCKKNVFRLFQAIKKRNRKAGVFYALAFGDALKIVQGQKDSVVIFMGAGSIDAEARKYFKSCNM